MSKILKNSTAIIFLIACISVGAHGKDSGNEQAKPADRLTKSSSDLVSATNQYKESVKALIAIYENALKTATEALEKRKELYAQGIISKRELEAAQQAVKEAQASLDLSHKQITESDQLIAEVKAEQEMAKLKSARPAVAAQSRTYSATPAIMRNSGSGGWSLTQASMVQNFFSTNFGRSLPISAFGQTATHDQMRFDHHNSLDVAVHPDSAEGKALIAYLRGNGIPFLAFRSAVPGAATGAHIHIGYPSHKI
jgi:hypothetical protein